MEHTETREFNSHKIATAFHDGGGKDIVIFCHGFRGTSVGPSRAFVTTARILAEKGVSSLRFDQYCSGNSGGDFKDSSFNDWLATTKTIAEDYLKQGYRVALFGQSMGGATVLRVGADVPELTAIVAWVPDASIDAFTPTPSGFTEEGGQLVQNAYWMEANAAGVAKNLPRVAAPCYIVQCTADEYVSAENHQAIADNAQPNHTIDTYEGSVHSAWPYAQFEEIIGKSVNFITDLFKQK